MTNVKITCKLHSMKRQNQNIPPKANRKAKTKENGEEVDLSQILKLKKDTTEFLQKIENCERLDPDKYTEVLELSPLEVNEKIKMITYDIVDKMMKGGDCELSVPSRNNKNQMYIAEVDRY